MQIQVESADAPFSHNSNLDRGLIIKMKSTSKDWRAKCSKLIYALLQIVFSPLAILCILDSRQIHPDYGMSLFAKYKLGYKMFLNKLRIKEMGTHPKVHLAMALKLLEMPPTVVGDVIECGTWRGGTAANLSLVCKIVNRNLRIYDSFEGLPARLEADRTAKDYTPGDFAATVEEVKETIRRYGSIENCVFIKGWFEETLPKLDSPVVLAYVDVDYEASLHTCIQNIWPHLVDNGYIFIDECHNCDYCALFYSEKWWRKYFDRTPPGLIGAGTGLPLGDYYVGPNFDYNYPLQHANSGAYTMKTLSGYWAYFPEEM